MDDRRKYQRYALSQDEKILDQFEVKVEGELVRLVDFSVGSMSILSKLPFTPGIVNISVNFKNSGRIDLIGAIVRVSKNGDMWRIGLDFSKIYNLNALRKV
jgi:PilZ domain